jgi:hypothetical protein
VSLPPGSTEITQKPATCCAQRCSPRSITGFSKIVAHLPNYSPGCDMPASAKSWDHLDIPKTDAKTLAEAATHAVYADRCRATEDHPVLPYCFRCDMTVFRDPSHSRHLLTIGYAHHCQASGGSFTCKPITEVHLPSATEQPHADRGNSPAHGLAHPAQDRGR